MAPVMLSRSPAKTPVHETYAPLMYELSALRLLTPFWPSGEHYCRFPGNGRGSVQVRTTSIEYPDLLAHHLAYQFEVGALTARWRVSIAPHLAGADGITFAIEPAKDDLDDRALADDLRQIGADLGARLRRLARARAAALAPAEATAVEPPGSVAVHELSGREREVLELFLSGLGVGTLARRLFISPHTVRNHLKHISAKLGVSSQRELRELFATTDE